MLTNKFAKRYKKCKANTTEFQQKIAQILIKFQWSEPEQKKKTFLQTITNYEITVELQERADCETTNKVKITKNTLT